MSKILEVFSLKLAIFGGSFDPPHLGHDSIVRAALSDLDIDKLIIVPTFISPFKNDFFASANLRLKWAKELWSGLEKVHISNYEILQKRPVPTIETVRFLKNEYLADKIYLIIGADHLANLSKWHEFDKLCEIVNFVVATRDEIKVPENFIKLSVKVGISSSQIRRNWLLEMVPDKIRDEVKEILKEKDAK